MDAIFHEKQDGSLCAQHCLNSLLQGSYFNAVDLGSLASRLDEEEREQMAEGGVDTEDYRTFLQQPSSNMDDSGYFSVQVISSALQVWGLELVPYCSTDERAKSALENPSQMQAFICNYKEHWFTIRKIGNQWFNLNSLLAKPQLISDTYLSLFLAQLRNEGYLGPSISTESDPDLQAALRLSLQSSEQQDSPDSDDRELQEAMRLSLQALSSSPDEEEDDEDALLKKAITMSLQC
ncbi:ataxin-3-like isoform X2 [Euwallacea fornicatus]|uniref:ataxin-3-like isoform X2 n=1 Tax=Euwallacea fornicatus TaxID=995702 RepID=UPI00338F69E8